MTYEIEKVTSRELQTVSFHGDELITFKQDGVAYVALRPVVEGIGIDWKAQFEKVKKDPVLAPSVVLSTTVGQDGRKRDMTCLPLDMLHGFLFKIDPRRVREELKEKLIAYQKECYGALSQYWTQGIAAKSDLDGVITSLDPKVMQALGGMFKGIVHKQLSEIMPALIQAEIGKGHYAMVSGMTASQVLDMAGVKSRKGMRGLANRVSNALRSIHIEKGVAMNRGTLGPINRILFDPSVVKDWLLNGGRDTIHRWADEKKGQGQLRLVSDEPNP